MNREQFLTCDHCGGVAISKTTVFDGEGDACLTCGMPGSVHLDAETSPHWVTSEEPDDKCWEDDCWDCRPEDDEGLGQR